MNFNIYKIETYGMKNIKEKITIEFYPKTLAKSSKALSNIKAIYGTNGAGKSAFIGSVYLYKQLLVKNLFLKQSSEIKTLNKIINLTNKEFYFSVVYGTSKKDIYKHEIKIAFENDNPFIEFERISRLNAQTISGGFVTIVESSNGQLSISSNKQTPFDSLLLEKTRNILKHTSLSSIISEKDMVDEVRALNTEESLPKNSSIYCVLLNRIFGESLVVYLDNMDIHQEYDESDFEDLIKRYFDNKEAYKYTMMCSKRDVVVKSNLDSYLKNVRKLYEFLRIFKTDLLDIEIEKEEDKDFYYCKKKMVYKDYKVDSEYESTGIKKMMDIFNSIEAVIRNNIVFIDELDANINGVYLKALLEYLDSSKKGQLCFTTHNLYPMQYLYAFSNAIDFIGETGKVVSWVKNGNYRPYKLYPEGMIADSPFNIEPIDFVSVFESEDWASCNS